MVHRTSYAPGTLSWVDLGTTDAAVARVKELAGAVLFGPMQIPGRGIAIVRDPRGAVFALFEGRVDP